MGIGNLYDPVNLESLHILNQCLRAHSLYKRDVNYLVADDGKVLIIDEFTGRVLPGRRWSDGLHQAVEAKENVRIQEETRTMATITFQNLFRLYKKLSGMTGTADTEADGVPRDLQARRRRHPDEQAHRPRRPRGPRLQDRAREVHRGHRRDPRVPRAGPAGPRRHDQRREEQRHRAHPEEEEDPARGPQREAPREARRSSSRRPGARAPSPSRTNMAGRGTDIILGGNPEMLAQARVQGARAATPTRSPRRSPRSSRSTRRRARPRAKRCKALGGLHILGTERHESRRIDNQLRGRAGRQGDPGSSRFYLSLEDDLMRIFAGDRVKSLMERMGMPDDEPIEHPWVTQERSSDAQAKVEERNFDIRKNLLEYDDVMSEQRKTVYKIRQQLLLGIYTPEHIDDDGKPTGKMREIKTLPRLVDEVKPADRRHARPLRDAASRRRRRAKTAPRRRRSTRSRSSTRWSRSARTSTSSGATASTSRRATAKKPKEVYERLLAEIPQASPSSASGCSISSTASSARSSKSAAREQAAGGLGLEGASATGSSSTSATKPRRLRAHCTTPRSSRTCSTTQAEQALDEKEKEIGTELLLRVFRHFYLEEIDRQWVEHLTNMEHLRDGIGLRGYGQKDPKQEYKKEGYDIFVTMMAATSSNVCTKLFKVQVKQGERDRADRARGRRAARSAAARDADAPRLRGRRRARSSGRRRRAPSRAPAAAARAARSPVRREGPKIGRNDPCPCGSGQKFKKCHGAALEEEGASDADDASRLVARGRVGGGLVLTTVPAHANPPVSLGPLLAA